MEIYRNREDVYKYITKENFITVITNGTAVLGLKASNTRARTSCRLINGQEDYAPMKNIIHIMPMETDTLEFTATESGDWFFHCHILYQMMSGMDKVF